MTLEFADKSKLEIVTMVVSQEPNSRPIPSLKLRVQPWLKLFIGFVCLMQGLRLLCASDPLGIPMGLVLLLISVPSCCYLGWRDYRELQEG
ncbi:MAG: hypothetical protein ACLQU1_11370 [Bryobacteraceae bacterium]